MTSMINCLWIARELPFPLDSGDRIYTALLSASMARAGVDVQMTGHMPADGAGPPADWPVGWIPVGGGKLPQKRSVLGALPLAAAIHPTQAFRAELDRLLRSRRWDAIVIDQLGSGWALRQVRDAVRREGRRIPIAYLSHNHEETLWASMVRNSGASPLGRLVLWQNYLKTRALERRLAREADLITTITREDAQAYLANAPGAQTLTLTPGYSGPVAPERVINDKVPRRVVIVGSFRWVVKQENLRQFLAIADPAFAARGIGLDVIGDVPDGLRAELEPGLRATRLHGFVDDIAPYFAGARIAVVPELIGGGFKLKFLDYMFGRMAIASIRDAASGLDDRLRRRMFLRDDLASLVKAIVEHIDDYLTLDTMQTKAFQQARALFDWDDRGAALRDRFERLAGRRVARADDSDAAPAQPTESPARQRATVE